MNLTKKQKQILDFIIGFQEEYGYTPTYQEIADHFKISSKATIFEHIKNLEKIGCIKTSFNESRSIQIIDRDGNKDEDTIKNNFSEFKIPLFGLIAAGEPIEAIEGTDKIAVPNDFASSTHFALQVKGDSMIEDGILEGDYIIVDNSKQPNNGDIVVAILENENATLKRFYKEKNSIRLQPANSKLKPFYVKDVQIQGVMKGLIRRY